MISEVARWLSSLAEELAGRLLEDEELHGRRASTLTLSVSGVGGGGGGGKTTAVSATPGALSGSRSAPLRRPTAEAIAEDSLGLFKRLIADR